MKLKLIKLPSPNCNIYLIDEDILIDAGCGFKNQKYLFLDKLKKANTNFDKIKIIILTHCHFDHSNGTRFFKNAKIYISKKDARAIKEKNNNMICSYFFGQEYTGRSDIHLCIDSRSILPLKNDFTLYVIETPGHTKGSICLYDKHRKSLFSGDTLFENTYGRYDLFGGNKKDLDNSIEKLNKLNIKTIYPGHGCVFFR